ncbi:hypothetical protein [Aliivibrio fischeri]|uniref:hypothetical protein n=1 Tax=Aliivibrio fischeri TaxID=668 RepID=UPI00080E55AA|nr:hypothetical protein [Aliivibrio fischeri]OCH14219.1 hypothetical protein A6E09_00505 [Aliivibrio fischeri]
MNAKYIVATGWWCDDNSSDDRNTKFGSQNIRKVDFFDKWYSAIKENTSAEKIIVIDSCSPVKPRVNKYPDIEWIELDKNYGHSTKHDGKYCGVSRSFLLSLMRTYVSDVDYWVYIEQDALIKGVGIIDFAISKMNKNMMFGSGLMTPQPIQQSMMIIKREYIPTFIKNYTKILSSDNKISPELKFAVAATPILRLVPEFVFKGLDNPTFSSRVINKLVFTIVNSKLSNYQPLPFGFGRVRPINFDDQFFYFQHGDDIELSAYDEMVRNS